MSPSYVYKSSTDLTGTAFGCAEPQARNPKQHVKVYRVPIFPRPMTPRVLPQTTLMLSRLSSLPLDLLDGGYDRLVGQPQALGAGAASHKNMPLIRSVGKGHHDIRGVGEKLLPLG